MVTVSRKTFVYLIMTLTITLGVFALVFCKNMPAIISQGPDVYIENGRIIVRNDSKLLNHLIIIQLKTESQERSGFKMIGQIIALANPPSAEREQSPGNISWVELDPGLSKSLGLNLKEFNNAEPGDVIGVTSVPLAYAKRVYQGQKVRITHYGLDYGSEAGIILHVRLSTLWWGDAVPVIFRINNAQEWLPGANCEVTFPLITSRSMSIPTTALLHEGLYDYVLQEIAPDQFVPSRVTVEKETPENMDILTVLVNGDKIVGRGAILLKPYIHQLLEGKPSYFGAGTPQTEHSEKGLGKNK